MNTKKGLRSRGADKASGSMSIVSKATLAMCGRCIRLTDIIRNGHSPISVASGAGQGVKRRLGRERAGEKRKGKHGGKLAFRWKCLKPKPRDLSSPWDFCPARSRKPSAEAVGYCRSRRGNNLSTAIPRGPQLTRIEPGVFFHEISVGHSGDIIANRAVQTFALDPAGGGVA